MLFIYLTKIFIDNRYIEISGLPEKKCLYSYATE